MMKMYSDVLPDSKCNEDTENDYDNVNVNIYIILISLFIQFHLYTRTICSGTNRCLGFKFNFIASVFVLHIWGKYTRAA